MEVSSKPQAPTDLPQGKEPRYPFYRRWVGVGLCVVKNWKAAALAHKYGSKKYIEVLALNNTCLFRWTTVYTPAVSRYSMRELVVWLISTYLWRAFNDCRRRKNSGILTKFS
jgi:hypothetical protein